MYFIVENWKIKKNKPQSIFDINMKLMYSIVGLSKFPGILITISNGTQCDTRGRFILAVPKNCGLPSP
ncbi:hypothetical protein DERP_006162 [Dermatophagoides pteronyssinus]|uniref:Uncharacterized protein n=1 Tax=Dermatophagoides pteronyssinus TaxID=6956 RepID=A0ABQ8JSM7_DERPT|nr:hypothetical protein DERP_006162 [Dermatophagoides pteronyssinus]